MIGTRTQIPRLLSHRTCAPASSTLAPKIVDLEGFKKKKRGRSTKRNYDRVNLRRSVIKDFASRNRSLEEEAANLGLKWELEACTVVERTPVVTPEMPQWEKDWIDVRDSLEYYKIHDWPKGLGPLPPEEIDRDGPDFTLPFDPAPRVTNADLANDVSTLERQLPMSVYLAVRESKSNKWQLPSAILEPGEFLGQAAERAALSAVKDLPRLFYFRRQPIGQYWRKYDTETSEARKAFGSKGYLFSALVVDCYECLHDDDEPQPSPLAPAFSEIAWFTKDELQEALLLPGSEVTDVESDAHLAKYLGLLLD